MARSMTLRGRRRRSAAVRLASYRRRARADDEPCARLAQQAGRRCLARPSEFRRRSGLGCLRVMPASFHRLGVDEGGVAAGVREQHRVVGRHLVERRVQWESPRRWVRARWSHFAWCQPRPMIHSPGLACFAARATCATMSSQVRASRRSRPMRNSPTPVKWPWPSMKPGIASMPWRSMTWVRGPIHLRHPRCAQRRDLVAADRDGLDDGCAAFIVTILPLRRTRSAGWANAEEMNKAANTMSAGRRMKPRITSVFGSQ